MHCGMVILTSFYPYDKKMPIEIGRLGYTTFEKGTWVGLWEVLPKEECGLIQSGTFKGGQTYSSEGVHNTSVNAELFAGFVTQCHLFVQILKPGLISAVFLFGVGEDLD